MLAIALGLVIAALCLRVGVRIQKKDGALRVALRYGPLRLPIYPPPKGLKRPEKPEKPPKKAREKPAGWDISKLDIGDAVCLAMDLTGEVRQTLCIDVLRADVTLATGDAAKTGQLLGLCWALLGMTVPVLEHTFTIRDLHIAVGADFESDKPRWSGDLAVSLRPIRLLWTLLKRRDDLLQLLDQMKTRPARTAANPQGRKEL